MPHLTDKHMNQLCKRMTNLKQISMWSSARHFSGFAFKQMSSLTKVTTLKFDTNKLITDEVKRFFFSNHSLFFFIASSSYLSFMHRNLSFIYT
jgi:hypothetical protein